jgi:hypothetical protein
MQKKFLIFKVNSFCIFFILVGLIYIDSSIFEFIDLLEIPLKDGVFNIIFFSLVIIFVYVTITIVYKVNVTIPMGSLFKVKFTNIKKIVYVYNIILFICLLIILYQVLSTSSYNIYLVYILLLDSHLFALFFSISGTIKFFQWLRIGKEKLSIIYLISFASFSLLICLSLLYNIFEISGTPVNITTTNYQKALQTTSYDIPEIYKFYISIYIFSFCAIWASTFFLLYDYISKKPLQFWLIMIIPLILFVINLFPTTITFMIYLVSLYPFFLPFYTIISTFTFLIGPIIFSLAIFLMTRNTDNPIFKNHLLPIAYGLFLIFASTQSNLFSQILYPPFGLITILFCGLSLFLMFLGFYSSSIYITRNYSFVKTFVNRVYQFEFFKNIAKSELEKEVKTIFNKIEKDNIFPLAEKENIDEINNEEITKIIEFVKGELKSKSSNKNNNVNSS